jgi:TPR repeat protein
VKQINPKAVEWYTKAAEQGYGEAQLKLGLCYAYGRMGVKQVYEKAVEWFTKAAEQGHAEAQIYLAYCYENGAGVKIDNEKAEEWYTKAEDQGARGYSIQCFNRARGSPPYRIYESDSQPEIKSPENEESWILTDEG